MNIIEMVIAAVVAAGILGVVLYVLGQKFALQLSRSNEEQRQGSKDEIETGVKGILESNRTLLKEIIDGLEKKLESSQKEVSGLKAQNAAIKEQLLNTAKITGELQVSTEGLKSLLSNNRLRGEWGEQVAEDLLLAAGFVENVTYLKQAQTQEGRPDFTIKLPDGSKLNVDAKFPFDDLMAYQSADSETAKKQALNKFSQSIKLKVKGITSKDYINPEDQTLDFVVMFIPNEMIFSFIYEKLPDINEYCAQRKVVLAGPFGFTAVLRLVMQAYKNFGYEKNLQEIFGLVSKFQEEYEKFGGALEKLGSQLATTQKTYYEVEGTRSRQLTKVVDQISSQSDMATNSEATKKQVRDKV